MKSRRHFSSVWIAFLLGAGAILIWNTAARINRLDYLSTIGAPAENHTGGVTGFAPGDAELTPNNSLPIPDQVDASYHWLAQTQRMLNRGEARVRHIDYENAPFGRTVLTPSPYRWWLGFLAWCEHLATGAPPSTLVEKAALLADPLLWGIIILGSAILAAKCFGSLSAYLVCRLLLEKNLINTRFSTGGRDDGGPPHERPAASEGAHQRSQASRALARWGLRGNPDHASGPTDRIPAVRTLDVG